MIGLALDFFRDFVEATAQCSKVTLALLRAVLVARGYFKLLAYKDEYEVARLYTDPEFTRALSSAFEGAYKLRFHLAIPALSRPDPATGEPAKRRYGAWLMSAFHLLAPLKFLRGTPFDIFGYGAERRLERGLITEYEATLDALLGTLAPDTLVLAAEIASLPEGIRGYGPIKERSVAAARIRQAELMEEIKGGRTG